MKTPLNSYHLYPESQTKFFDVDFGFTLDFQRNSAGVVDHIILDRGGVISTIMRAK